MHKNNAVCETSVEQISLIPRKIKYIHTYLADWKEKDWDQPICIQEPYRNDRLLLKFFHLSKKSYKLFQIIKDRQIKKTYNLSWF